MVRDFIKELDLNKILWRVIGVLFLMLAFNIKIVHISTDQAKQILEYKREHYTKELNEYELNEFIKLYPKFQHDIIFQDKDIDQLSEYPETADWVTKRWFVYQAWDAKRFFYVKKRAQDAMEIIKERKLYAGYLDQLKKRTGASEKKQHSNSQQEKTEDPKQIASEKLLELHQKKAADTGDFSEEELNLVAKKSEELKKLFE